jgi:hypothetical protein
LKIKGHGAKMKDAKLLFHFTSTNILMSSSSSKKIDDDGESGSSGSGSGSDSEPECERKEPERGEMEDTEEDFRAWGESKGTEGPPVKSKKQKKAARHTANTVNNQNFISDSEDGDSSYDEAGEKEQDDFDEEMDISGDDDSDQEREQAAVTKSAWNTLCVLWIQLKN